MCPQGKVIPFKKVFYETKNHTKKKEYRASKKLCIDCPKCSSCLGKSTQEKKFTVTYYRAEYQRNIAQGKQSTGTLHEIQAAKYGRARVWNPNAVYGNEQGQHYWY